MARLKSEFFLFLVFSILRLDFSLGYEETLVAGNSFTMPCYDDISVDEDAYIELEFTPLGSSDPKDIGRYKLSTQVASGVSGDYSGRLSFTPANSLTITGIAVQDEGTYKCTTRGFSVEGEPSKSTTIEVHVQPTIVVTLIDSPLQAGSGLVPAASCFARGGKPAAQVSWSMDRFLQFNQSMVTTKGEEPKTNDTSSTLSVAPTQYYDKQPFICTIRHEALPNGYNVTTVVLEVEYSPTLPSIDVVNDNTQLRCEAMGNPVPLIKWTMPNGNTAPDPIPRSSTVRIISPEDPERQNDTYICEASNGILPSTSNNITTAEAVRYVAVVKTTNAGAIVGIVIGCLLILAIIGAAVYWFFIRKQREKDSGPYQPSKIVRSPPDDDDGWGRSSGRPMIQHANENLNKNAPPSPTQPPPHGDDDDASNYSQSDVEEFTEGHDVELNSPVTEPEDNHIPTAGIVSKNSVNFQHRRQRPSTSPHSRSQSRRQPQPSPRTPEMSEPHYEVPPNDYYEDDYDQEDGRLVGNPHHDEDPIDDRFYDRPEDRYPGYQQPRYDEPPHGEHLPPYTDTVQYASIDHSYNGGKSRTRPPYQEPVEYAEIRSKGQIV